MSHIIATILSGLIACLVYRQYWIHRITDLKNSHKEDLRKTESKWFSDGFDDGRAYAAKECKLMKIAMSFEDLKKYRCSHSE
jgi:hypothetical protein